MSANRYEWKYSTEEGGYWFHLGVCSEESRAFREYIRDNASNAKAIKAYMQLRYIHSIICKDAASMKVVFRWDVMSGVTVDTLCKKPCDKEGLKFDEGKRDYTLLPWEPLEEVVKVLEVGEKKYARDNWQKVNNANFRYLKASFRHLISYAKGEQNDPETGLSHLAHACCCMLFLLHFDKG